MLSEINFMILNLWYINFGENFKKYNKIELIERYHQIKKIESISQCVSSEVKPLFEMLDLDNSGSIDFNEYKLTRFLIEGNTKMKQLKIDFFKLNGSNKAYID